MDDLGINKILESTTDLIAIHGIDGRYQYVSPSCERLLGYSAEELVGLNPRDIIHKDDHDRLDNYRKNYNPEERSENFHYRFLKKNGGFIWVISTVFPQKDSTGKIISIITSSRDVTQLIDIQQKLLHRNERYQMLANNLPGVIYLCNNDDTYSMIYMNDKVHGIIGYESAEFLNGTINFVKLYHPDDSDLIFKTVDHALKNDIPFELSYRLKHKNGTWRWIEEYGQGIYKAGKLIYIEGVLLDVTKLKRTQQELENHVNNLERIVLERTVEIEEKNRELVRGNTELKKALERIELTQEKLIQSEKLASLGELVAGVGHELNNPLNYIKNGSLALRDKLVKSENLTKDMEMLMDAIQEGVSRSTDIVQSLKEFSRQSDSLDEVCILDEILENCLIILENNIKGRIEVIKNIQPCNIRGNSGRLHQLFLNLISNAEQAMPDGGTVTLSVEALRGKVIVSISDTGTGIDSEILPRIANPFFTTKDPGKGTGLGLSIGYKIVEEHGGKVEVSTKLKKGTTFKITFAG